ncbi:MAG TPA: hypothetical protein VKR21_16830 [Solirubrobacteraceae bacterium]|nr:hypothetical protein [Solirubrobacteraceae bacterium]
MYAKRIFATAATTALLTLGAASAAAADPSTAPGPGDGSCLGPPGQSGLVQAALDSGMPPGYFVSSCNGHGHGQNQGGGGSIS